MSPRTGDLCAAKTIEASEANRTLEEGDGDEWREMHSAMGGERCSSRLLSDIISTNNIARILLTRHTLLMRLTLLLTRHTNIVDTSLDQTGC